MRVNDLAKELGKSNKEVLEILQKNNIEVKSHMASITDDQVSIVKKESGASKPSQPQDAPKKKITAVYRPQNSQQMKSALTRAQQQQRAAQQSRQSEQPKPAAQPRPCLLYTSRCV